MQEVTLIATAAMGLEAIVAREVRQLGYEPQVQNGRVTFKAPLLAIPRCNLWLRTADRVKVLLGEFKAETFDELFEGTKALPWENFIEEEGQFPVSGKSHQSKLHSVPRCQAIVKRAIADRLLLKYGLGTRMPETGSLFKVEVALRKNIATLTLDTSGEGLHKRGYRTAQGEAPLQETLAAALILLTNWRVDEPLIDPFCGSGTIPIEAALIGQNIAPGFNRSFVSEDWQLISQEMWDEAYEEVENEANYDQELLISGSDINHQMIKISEANALEAGVNHLISWKQMQVRDLTLKQKNGYLIGNPPYGKRIDHAEGVEKIYQELGSVMNEHPSWSVYIMTAFKNFEKAYGKEATKKRKLFNGFIQTDYFQYFGKKVKDH